jgi:hypothetical protein
MFSGSVVDEKLWPLQLLTCRIAVRIACIINVLLTHRTDSSNPNLRLAGFWQIKRTVAEILFFKKLKINCIPLFIHKSYYTPS